MSNSIKTSIITILMVIACDANLKKDVNNKFDINHKIKLNVNTFNEEGNTKNTTEVIANYYLFIYNNSGELILDRYYANTLSQQIDISDLSLNSQDSIHIYVIANTNNITPSQYIYRENIINLSYPSIYSPNGALVYSGFKSTIMSDYNGIIEILLTPVAAKYSLIIDKTLLNTDVTLDIMEVQICNTPNSITFFKNNIPEHTEISASNPIYKKDVINWNYSLLIPENAQGVIGNATNPKYKDPYDKEDCCTFLKLTAQYKSSSKEGLVEYRHYLGENNTNNFNIFRNQHYVDIIHFKGSGIDENSWRVVKDSLKEINYENDILQRIYFKNSSYKIDVGESSSLTVETDPLNYLLTYGDISYTSSNNSIAEIDLFSGEITGVASGTVLINAFYNNLNSINTNCYVSVYNHYKVLVNYIEHLEYNSTTHEIINAYLSVYCKIDLPRPSNMNIVHQIYPELYAKARYSYIQNNSTITGEFILRLNDIDNNDNPSFGLKGEQKLFFSTNISNQEEYSNIMSSLNITLDKIDLYTNLIHVTN